MHIHNLIKTNSVELKMKEAFESLLQTPPPDIHYNYLNLHEHFAKPDTTALTSMVILQTFREYRECLRVLFQPATAKILSR